MCSLNSSFVGKCSISFPISDFSINIFSYETEIGEMSGGKDQIHDTQSKELNSGCDLQPFEKEKDSLRIEYKHSIASYQKLLFFSHQVHINTLGKFWSAPLSSIMVFQESDPQAHGEARFECAAHVFFMDKLCNYVCSQMWLKIWLNTYLHMFHMVNNIS